MYELVARAGKRPWNDTQKQAALTGTLSHQHHPTKQAHAACKHQPPGTIRIKHRSNLYPTEEGEESVETEDPAHGAGRHVGQLVRDEVCLKRPRAVEIAKAGRHAAEGAKDDEPGTQATFGKGVSIILVLWSRLPGRCGLPGGKWNGLIDDIKGWSVGFRDGRQLLWWCLDQFVALVLTSRSISCAFS